MNAVPAIARLLSEAHLPQPEAIGHRVVHGGPRLRAHIQLDATVLRELEQVRALSPLHAPVALAIIAEAQSIWPTLPQIACFDTVFHASMPDVARVLPLPREFEAQGIQRYGFHGLSCESIVRQLSDTLPSRLIIAHLGSGASVTAVRDGKSIDTSMGLTPSGGIIMGTRAGDLDPGALIYLLREKSFSATSLEDLVDRRSGFLGISGLSADLRVLHAAAPSHPGSQLAIAMFCRSVAKQIASMIVTLGGVDAIVFAGGIGENDALVRQSVCQQLGWLGVTLDAAANSVGHDRISDPASRTELRVLPAQEDAEIAHHVAAILTSTADNTRTACGVS